ncbi:MAG: TetR family transcriptional regulator [Rubrivivax sp.]|nr:MAG: TetR family transcriptional regulator [Rubrivivax sp.]
MRRTKEDALLTRGKLLDTAELLFSNQGVARTSLQDIAHAAGLTRGAIYWHFADKADLFNAMMERATMPMEEALKDLTEHPGKHPLRQVRDAMVGALKLIAHDERTRRVMEIARRKAEFVDDMSRARDRHLEVHLRCRAHVEGAIRQAQRQGLVKGKPGARAVAVGIMAIVNGLIEMWMLDATLFPLVKAGEQALDTYLAGLQAP